MAAFNIIESTLREGEQFANAFFTTEDKVRLATMLDRFGVEYLELTSPLASPQSRRDCETIAGLGLRAKILTHTRCHPTDAAVAIGTGVDGVDVVIGTSSQLREFGHGLSIDEIIAAAQDVIPMIREAGLEVRFSTEDSLRSELDDLLRVYHAAADLGVDRVGVADTVGVGAPHQIAGLVRRIRAELGDGVDIEFHGHDDAGCAIANSHAAIQAGATHVDTSVLGIGERNGITPLGGLIARMYVDDPDRIRATYELPLLHELDHAVAELVGIDVPFNNYVTGFSAFTHKAGIHAKAVLNEPSTYEALRPEDFGLSRYVHVAHRLTGWHAIRHRAAQLGLDLDEATLRELTQEIKGSADGGGMTLDDVDSLLARAAATAVVPGG